MSQGGGCSNAAGFCDHDDEHDHTAVACHGDVLAAAAHLPLTEGPEMWQHLWAAMGKMRGLMLAVSEKGRGTESG